ncbi:YdcH family protein [Echinimonas agarilytica]|uniref:YdcH family protein n=1 Tax=Echinimonas agarilytica TaxID=1215918 RepID=A0AA42B8B7_9GAMM|nr:YdcH family protein [Echinimonas agarilytica]MCM2680303.1 YdcH family protein [Echinimonas agarilytica]
MLGESHSLIHDFPESKDTINALISADPTFAKDAKTYHQLDEEIRKLELKGAPIEDDAMHTLKHNRSVLKDSLYQRIIAA